MAEPIFTQAPAAPSVDATRVRKLLCVTARAWSLAPPGRAAGSADGWMAAGGSDGLAVMDLRPALRLPSGIPLHGP